MSITILYIAAAMAAGLLFNRFAKLISLPNVTGYLVAGLLIGPSVLNLIPKDGTEALNVLVTLALDAPDDADPQGIKEKVAMDFEKYGGVRVVKVERVEDAAKAFIEARAEGEAVFGDGECYMEKFVAPAHHVEVQIMADKQGHVFSLGERECSVQRRNQKLIEESPAPCLDGHDDIRARMHKAARDLARAVGYEGAGTIEFLYSDDGNFYFMEMNTRLQVEHPVTEFVTDTDLVKWQLRVAAGQPLPFEREDMPVRNHAMECRINAETPDFLPSCGTVTALRVPGGPRVRWDSAMFTGATVPPYYDSMLGKLIVCAPTRDGAIRKMRSALGELVIEGVSENSELQLDVLANGEFLSGMYHTDLMGHLYADE